MRNVRGSLAGTGAVLFLGDYYGTLAAARCLGARGVDVILADPASVSRTRASRYVRHFVQAPPLSNASGFIDWLIEKGRRGSHGANGPAFTGRVLFPATDEMVFLFATHRDDLAPYYRLYQPGLDTVYRILNKQRLYEACAVAGVRYPATWFPRGEQELLELLPLVNVEVFIKPKSQIQLRSKAKGAEIPRGGSVVDAFNQFVRDNRYGPELEHHDPEVVWPMLQAYHRSELHGIYSLAGFVDGSGRPPLIRAAIKVLQRPRNMGIGICFESATPDARLVERVSALLTTLDYRGIFDLEFIVHEGEYLLIDFNPRAYGQMAFEIARGLPSPYLHYLAAIGDDAAYGAAHAQSARRIQTSNEAYCHGLLLSLMDAVQIADTGRWGRRRERWRKWTKSRRSHLTDAVRQRGDFGPTVIDAMRHCSDFLRRPRSFLHSLR